MADQEKDLDGTTKPGPRDGTSSTDDDLSVQEVASRTVSSSMFNVGARAITLVLGFARSVLLARWLVPEDFGLVALALFFTNLASSIATFGLNSALIQHRKLKPATVSTHFVLRMGLMSLAFTVTLLCIPLFHLFYADRPSLVPLVVALSAVGLIRAATSTPTVLLQRDLAFRRLAALDVISSAGMLGIASWLASSGWGPWSLVLGEQLTGALVSAVGVWLYRPPWRISLRFDRAIARQYLRFGRFVVATVQLNYLLDQFDDFWAATALGSTAAGYYSKAYEFARYPRRVFALPLQSVFYSAYARLQSDRRRLSQAYYRLNSLVVRTGFLFALVLALIATEFVELLLTAKWLPMVSVFRLMLIYTMLDPLMVTAGNLVVAVGHPQILTRIRLAQLAVFAPLVILLASLWNIEGIALAADAMLLVGVTLILHQVRRFVDFSIRRMFAFPLLALVLGGAAGLLATTQVHSSGLWLALLVKAAASSIVYIAVLMLFEHQEYRRNLQVILSIIWPDHRPAILRRT